MKGGRPRLQRDTGLPIFRSSFRRVLIAEMVRPVSLDSLMMPERVRTRLILRSSSSVYRLRWLTCGSTFGTDLAITLGFFVTTLDLASWMLRSTPTATPIAADAIAINVTSFIVFIVYCLLFIVITLA